MISFHTHSGQFCLHATGTLESVVLSAIARGFAVYGFSEHMPRYRQKDLYPEEEHLTPDKLVDTFEAYVTEARRLQTKYADRIRIVVGMETERILPSNLDDALRLRTEFKLDYLVGSVHHVDEHPIDFDESRLARCEEHCRIASGGVTIEEGREEMFKRYFDQQYELLRDLRPEVVGHFDLIRMWRRDHPLSEELWRRIRRNVQFVVAYGGLFEVNARAYKKGLPEAYPQRDILEYIVAQGGRLTLGDDSHGPEQVGLYYDRLMDYVNSAGVTKLFGLRAVENGTVEQVDYSHLLKTASSL